MTKNTYPKREKLKNLLLIFLQKENRVFGNFTQPQNYANHIATSGFQLLTRKKKAILKIITKSMIKAIKNEKKNFKHVFTIIFFKICSTFVNVLSVLYGDLDVWITLASIEKIFSQSLFS